MYLIYLFIFGILVLNLICRLLENRLAIGWFKHAPIPLSRLSTLLSSEQPTAQSRLFPAGSRVTVFFLFSFFFFEYFFKIFLFFFLVGLSATMNPPTYSTLRKQCLIGVLFKVHQYMCLLKHPIPVYVSTKTSFPSIFISFQWTNHKCTYCNHAASEDTITRVCNHDLTNAVIGHTGLKKEREMEGKAPSVSRSFS